ncbi:hypothetical protein [Streptomyces sp. NPDC090022]|uniref:hypothetical protein n=1 Tax=Streptomyces sp. NPDC090022 TaxID=3365920 RepID=UPI00380C3E98
MTATASTTTATTATASAATGADQGLAPARLTHRLGLWFAHAYVFGMCATIGG